MDFSQSGLYVKRPDNSILLVASSDFSRDVFLDK